VLINSFDQIPHGDKCVVQQYISNPYLIDGLKFDFRVYVLVTGSDPLRVFIYEEGLARFST
jgi:tubulin polyglutamylase TTLL6/13